MKITPENFEEELPEAIPHTGAKSKGGAMVTALAEVNRRRRREELVKKFGTLDDFMTQEELRRMREEP